MNVLLVVLDTARRDAFEVYGARPGVTPAVRQLGNRGTVVQRAYSTAPWTLPSHASMFAGLLPRQMGLAQPPGGTPQSARPIFEHFSERMLAAVLRRGGFATHAWSTNVWASPHAGLDVGFDSFEYVCSGREERMNELLGKGRRAQLAWAREGLRARGDDGAAAVGERLRRSISDWSGEPTFWFVNLCECHSPYLPPRPWNDLSVLERVRAALEVREHLNFESICLYAAGGKEIPAAAMARMRHLYERAISYMDEWLARVLESLDARGILDDTLVIVTSDHGENFGEGGLIAHGFSVDQRLTHMPLVLAGPGADIGQRTLSLAELPRIIARAAGVEDHPYEEAGLPAGFAVAQSDPMAPAEDPRVRSFAQRFSIGEAGVTRLCARFTAVTDGSLKLVLRDGEELLYDLESDPAETAPLDAGDRPERRGELRQLLELPGVERSDAAPAVSGSAPAQASEEELAAIERQMKLLGYM